MHRFIKNPRRDVDMCDHNFNMLSLQEAVTRAEHGGPFLMTERTSDAFEGDSADGIDIANSPRSVGKIDSYLAGISMENREVVKAPASAEPAPASAGDATPATE